MGLPSIQAPVTTQNQRHRTHQRSLRAKPRRFDSRANCAGHVALFDQRVTVVGLAQRRQQFLARQRTAPADEHEARIEHSADHAKTAPCGHASVFDQTRAADVPLKRKRDHLLDFDRPSEKTGRGGDRGLEAGAKLRTAAIAKLGEMFTAAGGKWEQTSIAGHTANTLAKLRADVVAGSAPPAVQLRGPEIAERNATGQTANMNDLAAKEGRDEVVAPALLPVMKPTGDWVAAPMNIHRINWLWASTAAMAKAGIKEMPKTWAEYNADCDKAVAAGLICEAHFSADWTDSRVFEVVVYG